MSTDLLQVRDEVVPAGEGKGPKHAAPSADARQGSRLRGALSKAVLRLQTDERLVELSREGCDQAYEVIDERYRSQLVRYCTPILGPDRAQDVAQQTLTQAFVTLRNDERPIRLRWWLLRVAHNFSIDVLRRKGSIYEELDENYDGVAQPPALVEQRQDLGDVLRRIDELPERQRAALLLREFEGRSYEEIAQQLNSSAPVVSQLLQRARSTLRKGAACLLPLPVLRMLVTPGALGGSRVAELTAGIGTSGGGMVGVAAVAAGLVALSATGGHDQRPLPGDRGDGVVATAEAAPSTSHGSGLSRPRDSAGSGSLGPGAGGDRPRAIGRHARPRKGTSNRPNGTASRVRVRRLIQRDKVLTSQPATQVQARTLTRDERRRVARFEKDARRQAAAQQKKANKQRRNQRKREAAQQKQFARQESNARRQEARRVKLERQQAVKQLKAERRAQRDTARQQQKAARDQARAQKQAERNAAREQARAEREARREAARQQREAARQQRQALREQKRAAQQQSASQ